MNAVEAIEQLGAMGRMLQAREEGLQQPSLRLLALCRTADWEKVLGDPVAALSQFLGAAGGGQAAKTEIAPEAADAPLPLAPFRWQEDRLLAGSGIPAAYGGQSDALPPAGGMRLARRQTSLLGILNANLENRAHMGTGQQGVVAPLTDVTPSTGDVRPAGRDESPVDPHGPAARWSVVPSSFAGDDEMRQSSPQGALSAGGLQQEEPDYRESGGGQGTGRDRQGGGPSAAAGAIGSSLPGAGDAATKVNAWNHESLPQHGYEGVRPPGHLGREGDRGIDGRQEAKGDLVARAANGPHQGLGADQEPWPPVVQSAVDSRAPGAGRAGDWIGWGPQNADGASAQAAVWAAAHDGQEDRPLTMAQIEQVLAALDERLELGLLRMYGAAGGRA